MAFDMPKEQVGAPSMNNGESNYLMPPPLTPAQVKEIYGRNAKKEYYEQRFGRAAFAAVCRASRKGARP
jgi:hypothetical protein